MTENTLYTNNSLSIEWKDSEDAVRLVWTGKSSDRTPGKFILPILNEALEKAGKKTIAVNFVDLEYMNSSTVSPLVKMLASAKNANQTVTLEYNKGLKWQELSFTALRVFETADKRIQILGK